jgi:hypothetical protein
MQTEVTEVQQKDIAAVSDDWLVGKHHVFGNLVGCKKCLDEGQEAAGTKDCAIPQGRHMIRHPNKLQ